MNLLNLIDISNHGGSVDFNMEDLAYGHFDGRYKQCYIHNKKGAYFKINGGDVNCPIGDGENRVMYGEGYNYENTYALKGGYPTKLMNLDTIGVQQNCQSGALLVLDTFSGSFKMDCPGGSRMVMLL